MSYAVNAALYQIKKRYGLKADARDYPENYVGYDPIQIVANNAINANQIATIAELRYELSSKNDEIKHLKNNIKRLKRKLYKAKIENIIINIDNNTTKDKLLEFKKILEE